MDEIVGALAEIAVQKARQGLERRSAAEEQGIRLLEEFAAKAADKGGVRRPQAKKPVEPPAQQEDARPQAAAPASAPPAAPTISPAPLAGAFVDRAELLRSLIVLEVLGVPPSIRPRELRSDAW